MQSQISNTFDNFKQRQLQLGLETKSETEYKGYLIILRAYNTDISVKIAKLITGKRIYLREEHWNFYNPIKLLEKMKNYIDTYEYNLLLKLKKHE